MNWSKYPIEMQKKKMYFTTIEDMMTTYRPELKVDNKPLVELPMHPMIVEVFNPHLRQQFSYPFFGTPMQAMKIKRLLDSVKTISELLKIYR